MIRPANYGRITSVALDPIEKKPLRNFHPGSKILSVGSFGCNLRCPFCQNYAISYSEEVPKVAADAVSLSPTALVDLAAKKVPEGNIGIAYTYNEPLLSYQYVMDCSRLAHLHKLLNVVVTNGSVCSYVTSKLEGLIDAMNIDLKAFSDDFYSKLLSGDRHTVMDFIEDTSKWCHIELTCLVIPGENDTEDEIEEMAAWIASLNDGAGRDIPLHLSRFFPQYHMTDRDATDVSLVYRLTEVARKHLNFVYTGNC